MASVQAAEWREAVLDECRSIVENNTFELVPRKSLPSIAKPLRSMLIFKTKLDSEGNVKRYKARLVVKGCGQRKGIDYDEVFAPVAHHETIRVALSLAAADKLLVHQMDVKTAFLVPELQETVYMELPRGWPAELEGGGRGDVVARLIKAIYGLKQASKAWHSKLSGWMISYGFTRSQSDPCLFLRPQDDGGLILVTVWVDDLLIYSASLQAINAFKAAISAAFSMKDLGEAHFCLGMRFTFGKDFVALDQERYIHELLQRFGMASCNPSPTPLAPGTELRKAASTEDPGSSSDQLLDAASASRYKEIVGALLYLVTCTRPDLAMAVNQLSRHMSAPSAAHFAAAKHVLRHLRGTADLGIRYQRGDSSAERNVLTGYADASWMSVPGTSRSVSGYVFLLNGAAVSWRCKVQTTVALSTAEAEFDALCAATREAVYLRGLLLELRRAPAQATAIREDNQPCIALIKNPVTSNRTRHVALRFNFVREKLQAGQIDVVYCPTSEQLADIFTKMLPRPQHCKLRQLLLGLVD